MGIFIENKPKVSRVPSSHSPIQLRSLDTFQFFDQRSETSVQRNLQSIMKPKTHPGQILSTDRLIGNTSDAIQLKRSRKAGWNEKQKAQNKRLFERRAIRQAGYARAEAQRRRQPRSTRGHGDGYTQEWLRRGITIVFSSGHGYRANHHKVGQPPSADITALGSMNAIELAILNDIFGAGGVPGLGVGGERTINFGGARVAYRFKRISVNRIGIGTYFIPD